MIFKILLLISAILQFLAYFNTFSLIKKTKFNISWIMISIGFLLMAIRRLIELISLFDSTQTINKPNLWLAIATSFVMFIASFYIRKLFNLQARVSQFRKENEAKVLSAIINTEEKERKKFAKELHDGLGPILSTIKMSISAIDKTSMIALNEQIIEKTEITVDSAISAIKEISNNLSPHILENYGLEKAIKTIIDSVILTKKTRNTNLF